MKSVAIKRSKFHVFKRSLPFLGPAFVVSVGYIDPGNWATNIEGGATFGYSLLWVLLLSNIMAIILQITSMKLGVATGRSLAENCRKHFGKRKSLFLWITAELAAMATDLAEFLGAALGISILTGIPLFPAAIITGIITFSILALQKYGIRLIEQIIFLFVFIVAMVYVVELFLSKPNWLSVTYHVFIPELNSASILVAIGMLGATVMPHNVFLHSDLIKTRIKKNAPLYNKKVYKIAIFDSVLALNMAFFINASMVIVAASVFYKNGVQISSLEEAYQTLTPLLGGFASFIFAVALLSAGLSSSVTGTMAGQGILEGFLNVKLPVWFRRLITMLPALIIIGAGVNVLDALIISQVVLSLQLPFTIIPLLILTKNKNIMGDYVNSRKTNIILFIISFVVISLNIFLIIQTFS